MQCVPLTHIVSALLCFALRLSALGSLASSLFPAAQMASPAYEAGHPSDRGVETARIVERGLRESRAIDLESLCVLAGEKVWAVRVDAHVLDAGGNVLDALNLAVVTALLHFRRPDVTVIGDSVTVHSVDDRQPVALALHHIPVSCSFAFFDPAVSAAATAAAAAAHAAALAAGQAPPPLMVVDPSLKEELCADSGLTVTLNVHGELCCLQKSGGTGVDLATLLQATQVAAAKTADLTALIQTRLKEDAALQNTGNVVRGGGGKAPVFHAPAKPIDAFGSNVVKPAGQHVVGGKPIEISMVAGVGGAADAQGKDDSDEESEQSGSDEDADSNMADEEEFAQVAQKLQSKASAATPAKGKAK